MIWKLFFLFAVFYASLTQAAIYQCDIKGVPSFQQVSCASNNLYKRRIVPLPDGQTVRASELPDDLRASYGMATRYCNHCEDGVCTRCSVYTRLSEKTRLLRTGMTKQDVFTILGEPDWVVMPVDSGDWAIRYRGMVAMKFYWKNTTCNPVTAYMNANRKLIAWAVGRARCFEKRRFSQLPPDHFKCTGERQKLCRR